ncbi:SMI1/KNR4 family protein [Mucilaginibacter sp. CAU 1740]|uniref:SMI1/KNR4 family protein n=1 Tax=Mucilaginibacter sp. CAU 1740 TaxID=3140365 RepID=UPI00325B64FE
MKELLLFSKNILYLGAEIEDDRLNLLEKEVGFQLPLDFKYLLTKHNGISLMGTGIYGLDKTLLGSSLDEIYRFEHFETENNMPPSLFPFSPDGFGNHYCFDLSEIKNGVCPVVFWQHDFIYSDKSELEVCNPDLVSWIKEVMIEWTLEDTNYDGSDK